MASNLPPDVSLADINNQASEDAIPLCSVCLEREGQLRAYRQGEPVPYCAKCYAYNFGMDLKDAELWEGR